MEYTSNLLNILNVWNNSLRELFFNTKAQRREGTKIFWLKRETEWEWRKKPKLNIRSRSHFRSDFFNPYWKTLPTLNP